MSRDQKRFTILKVTADYEITKLIQSIQLAVKS